MTDALLLKTIATLSGEFGDSRFVRGGGGNTSCKNDDTLWVKPSGLALSDMTPENFVALSRRRIGELYETSFPAEEKARESAVKDFMESTIVPGSKGRPSVEAPLHNAFPQRFVVHTHPALANAMTCARNGAAACAELFPEALWVPFVEPGYTLSMVVRKAMLDYADKRGKPAETLFLGNHGVFIAHDEADGIRELYRDVMNKIGAAVAKAGCQGEPEKKPAPHAAALEQPLAKAGEIMGKEATEAAVSGWFAVPTGAISPDHIVYCKSSMYRGEIDPDPLAAYRRRYGYWPRVVETRDAVFGFGPGRKAADLALEMAWDGALIVRYAEAFGGIGYLEKRFVDFIEGWEVESYRQNQVK